MPTRIYNPILVMGVCGNCGRYEVSGHYCSYCLAAPFEGILEPTSADIHAVRIALIRLHGWSSKALCPELRTGRDRANREGLKVGMVYPL